MRRAERRHHFQRMVMRAFRKEKLWESRYFPRTEEEILARAKKIANNRKKCGCEWCQLNRKIVGIPFQERRELSRYALQSN